MSFIKRPMWLTTVSSVALITAGAAIAQEQDTEMALPEGELVVEQGEPQVTVTIDDPDVDVAQGAPEVTVEQPQPEITVAVPEPNVTVEQQAPIITVEQAQPVVTVRIPEPIITVRVPRPTVDVDQTDPNIAVEMPEPIVEFIRPEPRIMIEEAEPNIQVQQGEADVAIAPAEVPEVNVEQAEADVEIEQTGDADVELTTAEPEVTIENAEDADVNVQQAEADVRLVDGEEQESGDMAASEETDQSEEMMASDETGSTRTDEERSEYMVVMQDSPFYEMRTSEIVGQTVIDAERMSIGEIDTIGIRDDVLVAIVSVGGFLGMGEHDVAVPLDRLTMEDNLVMLPNTTEEELEGMPEYNQNEVVLIMDDMTIEEVLAEEM